MRGYTCIYLCFYPCWQLSVSVELTEGDICVSIYVFDPDCQLSVSMELSEGDICVFIYVFFIQVGSYQ